METELLKKLISEPSRWPYYLLLAAIVIVVLKLINKAADSLSEHISAKLKEQKGLLSTFKAITQILAIAFIIYFANAFYWSQVVEKLVPNPLNKSINTCEATVEIIIDSDSKNNTHYMDSGGYLAFVINDKPILVTAASDSWGRSLSQHEYMYRGLFRMDASDSAVGKPVNTLLNAQYVQVKFNPAPKSFKLIRGSAICVINGEVRFEIIFPSQTTNDGRVFIRDLVEMKKALE